MVGGGRVAGLGGSLGGVGGAGGAGGTGSLEGGCGWSLGGWGLGWLTDEGGAAATTAAATAI